MSEQVTDRCPTCGSEWAEERNNYVRSIADGASRSDWYVVCPRGHEFSCVSMSRHGGDEHGQYRIRITELIRGPAIKARKAEGPCVACEKPIQPGQMYVPRPHVRHLGCVLR